MAGEWLKFEKATFDKPEVMAIAAALNVDPDYVIGKLMRLWAWFDTHTTDGNARGVTSSLLDAYLRVTGFVSEVEKVGWLKLETWGISLPNFDRHCGETAKQRALTAKRVAAFKAGNAKGNGRVTQAPLPREEKKREEKKKEQKQKQPPTAAEIALPDPPEWVDTEAWSGFVAMRRRERHPLTPRAAKLVLSELSKLRAGGQNPTAILDQSTRNGWRDVYPIKADGKPRQAHGRVL